MSDATFTNLSGMQIGKEIEKRLCENAEKWQKKNNIPVRIIAEKSDTEDVYKFVFEKEIPNKLAGGVQKEMLHASIDTVARDFCASLKGKVRFIVYVGFSDEQVKKTFSEKKSSTQESTPRLNVSPVEPKYALSQVVLPDDVKSEIEKVVLLLKNMSRIYYEWGFIDIDASPRSIVNLWGPPGTGKTMTVHAIAKEMGKKILVLNYADIESKYVGDAPKNLVAAFDMAEKEDAVVFFDEADSFLGKRITNVDSGSEQAINSLRSQMLMKLEEFKGIVFFATNLHENYDRAFESRILKHIEFKLPNAEARKFIIKGKLPKNAPYSAEVRTENGTFDDALLTKLAETIEGFSGREIKNCVLESLVAASAAEPPLVTEKILTETFAKKKEEMDSLKREEKERKEKLSAKVKKNLEDKNFNVKKIDENGNEQIISADEAENENKKEGEQL